MMEDTSAEALQVQLAAIRRMPPIERLERAFELSEAMRELALVGLRARHPGRPEAEMVERLVSTSLSPL